MARERVRVRNAADSKQVRNARQEDRNDQILIAADLVALLDREDFRRYVARYVEYTRAMTSVIAGDPHDTYFNLGMQEVGQKMMNEVRAASLDKWHLLQLEAQDVEDEPDEEGGTSAETEEPEEQEGA